MAKPKSVFECQACGAKAPRWLGRCPECGGWNTLVETRLESAAGTVAEKRFTGLVSSGKPIPLGQIEGGTEIRTPSGIPELDRVLGGGIVSGSAVLIGGEPGIGKSTLLLQLVRQLAAKGHPLLYVSGEESPGQIRMRADRLGGCTDQVLVLSETDVTKVLEVLERTPPAAVVIDSVQTLFHPEIGSAPGTVSQVREVSGRLVAWAKTRNVPIFLVGHVTRDGTLGGPKTLEHLVDTVCYFEGGSGHTYRLLRAVKNRFGSTNEVGVFEMGEAGLTGIANASALFLSERPKDAPGSAIVPCLEGTRTLLVEVQALASPAAFAAPQRTTAGVERNRVQILAALLQKRLGLPVQENDLFVNVAGGMKTSEPAVDLGIVAAMISALRDRPLPQDAVFFGEVGLAGEVRSVSRPEARLSEAQEMGFRQAYVPASTAKNARSGSMTLRPVESVGDLIPT
ncbi:MAG: DNA repair protein RadA [Deltaproteobacteria bacterium]|nr:DNA repair protein RadA [Deltaproteobacteria bacterium]